MKRVVMKFGGSSVETIEKMQKIAGRIVKKRNEGYEVCVVVSAMGKSTNSLIQLAKQASASPNKRELDSLLATGEQVSTSLHIIT